MQKNRSQAKRSVTSDIYQLFDIFEGRHVEALYLWFIFMNQPDMAKCLCSRSRVRRAGPRR